MKLRETTEIEDKILWCFSSTKDRLTRDEIENKTHLGIFQLNDALNSLESAGYLKSHKRGGVTIWRRD